MKPPERQGAKQNSRKRNLSHFRRNEAPERQETKQKLWRRNLSNFRRNEPWKSLGATQDRQSITHKHEINGEDQKIPGISFIDKTNKNLTFQNTFTLDTRLCVSRSEAAHKFTLNGSPCARRQTKNPLEGGEHRCA
jgi:hypothetical protein